MYDASKEDYLRLSEHIGLDWIDNYGVYTCKPNLFYGKYQNVKAILVVIHFA